MNTVELVQAGLEAFNRRDVEAFAEIASEDFVWLPALPGAVEQSGYVGRAGIDRYFSESANTWEQLIVACDELRDLNDRVLMLGRALGRGLGSGVSVETPLAFIAEFRDGKVARVSTYLTHSAALKAAGLQR